MCDKIRSHNVARRSRSEHIAKERETGESSAAFDLTQTLTNKEKVFLRLADDRGWTYIKDPVDNAVLFEEARGKITVDT